MTRETIVAFLAAVLGASCSSETVGAPPPAPMNWSSLDVPPVVDASAQIVSDRERTLPDAFAASLASAGFAGLGALLDEDAHAAFPGLDDAHGRAAVLHSMQTLFGAFDGRRVANLRVWRTPSEQTIEWVMSGTQSRDWFGVAASRGGAPGNRPVAFRGITLMWTKDDGSITDVHVTFDVALVKAQLGAGPKELAGAAPVTVQAAPAQVFEQTGSAEERAAVDAVKASLDALENDQLTAFLGTMTDDVALSTLEHPDPIKGKDAQKGYYVASHRSIGQLDTTVENAWGTGSFAIVEYSIAGEQLGAIGWVPRQRSSVVRMMVTDVAQVVDGKIARLWRFDNPTQILSGSMR
jgi:hypothetical protein